jgi:hypothetical protein
MKQGKVITNNFTETIKRSINNTLNFENMTLFEQYNYESSEKKLKSNLNLCIQNNFIINSVVPYLRTNSTLETINENDRERFNRNPIKLSLYKYNVIDYWWILLAVNGYFNPSEFHDFLFLRIPNKDTIISILDKELYTQKPYGIVPS